MAGIPITVPSTHFAPVGDLVLHQWGTWNKALVTCLYDRPTEQKILASPFSDRALLNESNVVGPNIELFYLKFYVMLWEARFKAIG